MDARRIPAAPELTEETLGRIFAHLDNPADRSAVSRVCLQWKRADSNTRKHVQIANCYSIAPAALSRRFPNLVSLKLKGKCRASEYSLLPPNWGGYAGPWVAEVASAYAHSFQSLWLRRMQVTDDDLMLLARHCHDSLVTLKLDKCSGFSAIGLSYITKSCRFLKVLYLEESNVVESDNGREWLHELATNNPNVEELNFQYTTGLDDIEVSDLKALVENCRSLRSLKVNNEVDILEMERVVSRTASLQELGTGCCAIIGDLHRSSLRISFPPSIIVLSGLYELQDVALPMISSMLANLKKLDLVLSLVTQEGHCQILRHCVNLEVLLARNVVGDAGLIVVASTCKKLRRLRLDDNGGEGFLSPVGIIPLAENCVKLEFLVMYVSDLNNASLAAIGKHCTVMRDFRIVLLLTLTVVPDLPFDEGLRSLLRGCRNLTRFCLYARHGALTNVGMAYIGEYGSRLKWILLGCMGESDVGIAQLARGCHSLERLEIRDCPFTEAGLTAASVAMKDSLKFVWMQGNDVTESGASLLAMARPDWMVETAPGLQLIMAYASLAEPRRDLPEEMSLFTGSLQGVHNNGAS